MSVLSILAGPKARRKLSDNGLRQEDFALLAGASGGPKWFVLYGMDRYLFGTFFRDRRLPLATIGTSAGAWRLACLGLHDPLSGIERLARRYSTQTYSTERPDRHEVSREARQLVHHVLGETGASEIADNSVIRTHIIADRARGVMRAERPAVLAAGLAACGLTNAVSRRSLGLFFERTVFASQPGELPLSFDDLPTRHVALTGENVTEALMATGSIPLVMEGVRGVPGAPDALFRDGGITDYHFDLPFSQLEGLVLYPHFYAGLVPGWFDKMARWRRINPAHFDNVVVLAPSADFVATLPYGKIPDRKDFEVMGAQQRLEYWARVLEASHALGEAVADLVENGRGLDDIRPLTSARHKHL